MGEVAVKPRAGVAQGRGDENIMSIIAEAARNPSVDVDKLEKLLAMNERVEARQAETAFNDAMNRAQTAVRPIAADANNPQTRSRYASYLALDKALRPIYTAEGFSLSFNTGDGAPADCVRVLCYVSHRDGHTRTYHVAMPADGKGAKGGDVMTKTHATGAAMTYGQRYLLKMIFNIAVGEDHDGNDVSGEAAGPITAAQVQALRDLLARSGSDIEKFCKYFKIDAIPDLRAKDFERAVTAINDRDKRVRT